MNLHFPTSRKLLTAVVGSIISLQSAFAATVPAPQNGEVYLAFRASGGLGASSSYIVKLGQDTLFTQAQNSFTLTTLGNVGADLTQVYGPDWSTRADLSWGIFGVIIAPNSILYGSRERNPVTANSPAWPTLDSTSRNTTQSQITSVIDSIGGYRGRPATANSAVATIQPNSGDASSYYKQVATGGTNDFGSLSEWTSIEGSFDNGPEGTALDLYRLGSAVVRVGSFTISSTGSVQFTRPTVTPPTNVDTDGDGFLDSQEVVAGTNPNDAADFFRVRSVQWSSGGIGVAFNTIPARSYQIYYSENLAAGSWVLIHTEPGGAAPASFQYSDTDPVRKARPQGFYKVIVSQ